MIEKNKTLREVKNVFITANAFKLCELTSSMQWPKEMENAAEELADLLKDRNEIVVVHHYDADGMASAGVLGNALLRIGKKPVFKAVKQLYSESFDEIKGLGKFYCFADFGSSYIEELGRAFGKEFAVIDHHQLKSMEKERHLNPLLYGVDGGTEISGSGTCYLVAKKLGANEDLAALAIVGAVGDMQDSKGRLNGLNRLILEDGIKAGVLEATDDLRLYGRITRPLPRYLEFANNPIIPGLTADYSGSIAFLNKHGIDFKKGGEWRSYADLELEEKKELVTALILYMQKLGMPEWKIDFLFGEVYTLSREGRKTPLRDAKEFATLLNATGRHGRAEIGRAVCLGDREEFYQKALALLQEHRRQLRKGIELMQSEGTKEKESFYYFDAGGRIQDSIVGIVAGMLYGSGAISPDKPILAFAKHKDNSVKVSARGTAQLLRAGLNLGGALKEACSKLGDTSEGGGHKIAAGCRIQESEFEEFLALMNEIIKKQLIHKSIR